MDFIPIKPGLVSFTHFKTSHLVISARALHFIADDPPTCPTDIHCLRAADNVQLRDSPVILIRTDVWRADSVVQPPGHPHCDRRIRISNQRLRRTGNS
jgi:hypothetical protein